MGDTFLELVVGWLLFWGAVTTAVLAQFLHRYTRALYRERYAILKVLLDAWEQC